MAIGWLRRTLTTGTALVLLVAAALAAQEPDSVRERRPAGPDGVPLLLRERLATPAERARWLAPTRTSEALGWLERIAAAGLGVRVDTLALVDGTPPGGGEPAFAGPLPIVRVRFAPADDEAARTEAAAGAPRLRVLVLAGQRGDEPAGTQAALMAIRALAAGETAALRRHAELWIVPWLAASDLEAGRRLDPGGRDLDGDHLHLRSPSVRALHAAADVWRPHLVIDLQERPPSPYGVQIGLPTHPNVDGTLVRFGRFLILPSVARTLAAADIGFRETVTVSDPAAENPWLTSAPRAAGHARNAFALGGALALLVQSTSALGIEGLERRTERHRIALEAVLRAAVEQAEALRATVEAARRPPPAGRALSLRSRAVRDAERPSLTWRVRGELGSIVTETTDRWKPGVEPTLRLPLPEGWILAPEEETLARAAIDHGAEVARLARGVELAVQEHGPAPAGSAAAEERAGAEAAAVDGGRGLRVVERRIPAGAWLIRSRQPAARLLFTLLEPWSEDGWYAGTQAPWPVARLATPLTPLPDEASPGPGAGRDPGRGPGR